MHILYYCGQYTSNELPSFKEKKKARAGEIDQWFSVLAALPEDLGSIFSTHVVAYN